MVTGDQIANKIKVAMEAAGFNARSLADASKLNPTGVRDILLRKVRDPKYDTISKIADTLGVTVHALLHDEPVSATRQPFPSIPRYDIQLSAGHGAANLDHAPELDRIPFTQEFLEQKLGRQDTDGLICGDCHGESMLPIIGNGDLVVIDTEHTAVSAAIYALNYGEESYVKRIEKVDTGYSLLSDNPAYPPIVVSGQDAERLHIIGKIVWAGRVLG